LAGRINFSSGLKVNNCSKAEDLKREITGQYPNSRYAQIISNPDSVDAAIIDTPEGVYKNLYKLYEQEYFTSVLQQVDGLIDHFPGESIVPKFELLKAYTIGKLYGLDAYKRAIQYVADNYATSDEGKSAAEILKTQIPMLEQMNFSTADSKKWRIVFRVATNDEKSSSDLERKINLFMGDENFEKLYYTCDLYNDKESFISIHGFHSESYAKSVATLFTDNEKYKINLPAIVISNENYKVIQIKKNIETYLSQKKP
jgi:hypothetical protein